MYAPNVKNLSKFEGKFKNFIDDTIRARFS